MLRLSCKRMSAEVRKKKKEISRGNKFNLKKKKKKIIIKTQKIS